MAAFETGLIQLDILSPSRIEAYADCIKAYDSRYGSVCWHLVYQADVRCRTEFWTEERRRQVA